MSTFTLEEALQKIAKNPQREKMRVLTLKGNKLKYGKYIGSAIRQGDVYLTLVPSPKRGEKLNTLQLAPGTSQGSRHTVEGAVLYQNPDSRSGPIVVSTKDRFFVRHPQHGHYSMPAAPPGMDYVTSYQMDARTRRRVQD